MCPRRRAPAVFTVAKQKRRLAACLFADGDFETDEEESLNPPSDESQPRKHHKTTEFVNPPARFRRFHESEKTLHDPVETRTLLRARPPSRPSANPLGSYAARHDRCVTRGARPARTSRVSRPPSPPRARRGFRFTRGAGSPPRRSGRVRARLGGRRGREPRAQLAFPRHRSILALTGPSALPSLPCVARARPGRARRHPAGDGLPSRGDALDRIRSASASASASDLDIPRR